MPVISIVPLGKSGVEVSNYGFGSAPIGGLYEDVDQARALSGAVVIHVLSFAPFLVAGPLALRGHRVILQPTRMIKGHPQRPTPP
jgi:hypothetical protein